jgi:CheY-like chemotaxis protein
VGIRERWVGAWKRRNAAREARRSGQPQQPAPSVGSALYTNSTNGSTNGNGNGNGSSSDNGSNPQAARMNGGDNQTPPLYTARSYEENPQPQSSPLNLDTPVDIVQSSQPAPSAQPAHPAQLSPIASRLTSPPAQATDNGPSPFPQRLQRTDPNTLVHLPADETKRRNSGDRSDSSQENGVADHSDNTSDDGSGADARTPTAVVGAARAKKGTGLGLALAASLIESLGGYIALSDQASDNRTHFLVLLPVMMKDKANASHDLEQRNAGSTISPGQTAATASVAAGTTALEGQTPFTTRAEASQFDGVEQQPLPPAHTIRASAAAISRSAEESKADSVERRASQRSSRNRGLYPASPRTESVLRDVGVAASTKGISDERKAEANAAARRRRKRKQQARADADAGGSMEATPMGSPQASPVADEEGVAMVTVPGALPTSPHAAEVGGPHPQLPLIGRRTSGADSLLRINTPLVGTAPAAGAFAIQPQPSRNRRSTSDITSDEEEALERAISQQEAAAAAVAASSAGSASATSLSDYSRAALVRSHRLTASGRGTAAVLTSVPADSTVPVLVAPSAVDHLTVPPDPLVLGTPSGSPSSGLPKAVVMTPSQPELKPVAEGYEGETDESETDTGDGDDDDEAPVGKPATEMLRWLPRPLPPVVPPLPLSGPGVAAPPITPGAGVLATPPIRVTGARAALAAYSSTSSGSSALSIESSVHPSVTIPVAKAPSVQTAVTATSSSVAGNRGVSFAPDTASVTAGTASTSGPSSGLSAAGAGGRGAARAGAGGLSAAAPGSVSGGMTPFIPICHALVVDDDSTNRRIAKRMLEKIRVTSDVLDDGDMTAAALERTGQIQPLPPGPSQPPVPSTGLMTPPRPYDFILMDIIMIRSLGYHVCHDLKTNRGLVDVPIYAMTANVASSDIQRYRQSGMEHFVVAKPFDLNTLQTVVDQVLAKKRAASRPAFGQPPARSAADLAPTAASAARTGTVEPSLADAASGSTASVDSESYRHHGAPSPHTIQRQRSRRRNSKEGGPLPASRLAASGISSEGRSLSTGSSGSSGQVGGTDESTKSQHV